MWHYFCHKELHPLIAPCRLLALLPLYPVRIPRVIDDPCLEDDGVVAELSIEEGVTHFLHLVFFLHTLDVSGCHTAHQLLTLVSVETHEDRVRGLIGDLR